MQCAALTGRGASLGPSKDRFRPRVAGHHRHHCSESGLSAAPKNLSVALHLRVLRHFKRIIDINAELAHRALDPRVTEQDLHCAQILGSPINQGNLRATHRVRSIRVRIQSRLFNAAMHYPRRLLP